MKEQYNELFERVHLSETAKEKSGNRKRSESKITPDGTNTGWEFGQRRL